MIELHEKSGSDRQFAAVASGSANQIAPAVDIICDQRDKAELMRNFVLRLLGELRPHRSSCEIETLLLERPFWDTPAQKRTRFDLSRQAIHCQKKFRL